MAIFTQTTVIDHCSETLDGQSSPATELLSWQVFKLSDVHISFGDGPLALPSEPVIGAAH